MLSYFCKVFYFGFFGAGFPIIIVDVAAITIYKNKVEIMFIINTINIEAF